jgi:predicted lactoylglutathione lyase
MIAFPAGSKEQVNAMHDKAVALGATSDGAPGQRIEDVFYGAYVRDPDGNKLAFYIFG